MAGYILPLGGRLAVAQADGGSTDEVGEGGFPPQWGGGPRSGGGG